MDSPQAGRRDENFVDFTHDVTPAVGHVRPPEDYFDMFDMEDP